MDSVRFPTQRVLELHRAGDAEVDANAHEGMSRPLPLAAVMGRDPVALATGGRADPAVHPDFRTTRLYLASDLDHAGSAVVAVHGLTFLRLRVLYRSATLCRQADNRPRAAMRGASSISGILGKPSCRCRAWSARNARRNTSDLSLLLPFSA